ncbi:MAG: hypothetical protein ABH869_03915 [Candidatus Omnitrophota bacterium]
MEKSAENIELRSAIKEISKGTPFYLRPYKEPKVWGVNGIGEYWYGAEKGDKSSIAVIGNNTIQMSEIARVASQVVLGEGVTRKFGSAMPLVKILTPSGRLSVQFHDSKNELWIVTGIDEAITGEDPCIIVGFSKEVVDKYGKRVTEEYGNVLKEYGKALNQLIDFLEDHENGKTILYDKKDVLLAAEEILKQEKVSLISEGIDLLKTSRKQMERFYHYRKVKIGDVIPIPAGTLHALGSGIEIVEPQIPGPTQSLEDGETYPVRYYFPGYERDGARKKLDIDRVDEMIPAVTQNVFAEKIEDLAEYTVERLPGNFADKGLEVHRILFQDKARIEKQSIDSFHTLVAVEGDVKVLMGDRSYNVPLACAGCEMLVIPAVCPKYVIEGTKRAQVIDTFTPV